MTNGDSNYTPRELKWQFDHIDKELLVLHSAVKDIPEVRLTCDRVEEAVVRLEKQAGDSKWTRGEKIAISIGLLGALAAILSNLIV